MLFYLFKFKKIFPFLLKSLETLRSHLFPAMILMTLTTSLMLTLSSELTSALLHEAVPAMWLMIQTTSLISTSPSELMSPSFEDSLHVRITSLCLSYLIV